MNAHELPVNVMDLLARLRARTQSAEEQELLAAAIDAILFITSTGQRYAYMDYLAQRETNAPPPVVAFFKTREEADTWLTRHPAPPDGTHVLVDDQYFHVVYSRETGLRKLLPSPVMEHHIEHLAHTGLPPVVADLRTREEANTWLSNQVEQPIQTCILIAGQRHLAVLHRNLHHRSFHPVAISTEHDERKDKRSTDPR